MKWRALRVGPAALFVGAGAILYVATLAWSGSEQTWDALRRIGGVVTVLGTLIASCAYLIRFARWHVLLAAMGHRLPMTEHLRIYLSGLSLNMTPGKLGETIRTALLLPRGVRASQSLAAFLADRLSDVLGVALLGVAAGWVTGLRDLLLSAIFVIGLLGTMLLRRVVRSADWLRPLAHGRSQSRLARAMRALHMPLVEWTELWIAPRVGFCVALAALAYGLQGLVFHAYAVAVGVELPMATSLFIFASSTLIGAASLIPGGLGAMEAALIYQLVEAGASRGQALAATLAIRLSTLWTGMLLGSLMLLTFSRDAAATLPHARASAPPRESNE